MKDSLILQDVVHSVTSELDLDSTLNAVMRHMEHFFQPEQWSLLILDESRQELFYAILVGYSDPDLRSVRVKVGDGLAGWVAQHDKTLIVPEAEKNPLVQSEDASRFRIRSAICMPLRSGQRILGVLQLFNCRVERFSDEVIAFLHLLCDYAAVAIENARYSERVEELSTIDDCTGLFNQRHMYYLLEREAENCRLSGSIFSLVFIDLDRFRRVNAEHGHLIGSRLLAEFGLALRAMVRSADPVFRYGDDEFVVLLHDAGKSEAQRVVRRLHENLRERQFAVADDLDLSIRASYGVATWPEDAAEIHDLIHAADTAMVRVKNSTRDDVAIAGENLLPR